MFAPPESSLKEAVIFVSTVLETIANSVASGATTVISVSDTTVASAPLSASAPSVSPDGSKLILLSVRPLSWKPEPVMVTVLPPASGPTPGLTESMTGTPKV